MEFVKGGTETALVEDGGDMAGCVQLVSSHFRYFWTRLWT